MTWITWRCGWRSSDGGASGASDPAGMRRPTTIGAGVDVGTSGE